jgi:hypothetical protein
MVREPDNVYDFNCICFWLDPDVGPPLDVGYLPRTWAAHFAALMERRAKFSACVQKIERQGEHGQFLYLFVEIRQISEPEIKHRPKAEQVLRTYRKQETPAPERIGQST